MGGSQVTAQGQDWEGELPPQVTIQPTWSQLTPCTPRPSTPPEASSITNEFKFIQAHARPDPCSLTVSWPPPSPCSLPLVLVVKLLKQTMLPDPPGYPPLPSGLRPYYLPLTVPLSNPRPLALLYSPSERALICGQRAPGGSVLPTAASQQLDWDSGY